MAGAKTASRYFVVRTESVHRLSLDVNPIWVMKFGSDLRPRLVGEYAASGPRTYLRPWSRAPTRRSFGKPGGDGRVKGGSQEETAAPQLPSTPFMRIFFVEQVCILRFKCTQTVGGKTLRQMPRRPDRSERSHQLAGAMIFLVAPDNWCATADSARGISWGRTSWTAYNRGQTRRSAPTNTPAIAHQVSGAYKLFPTVGRQRFAVEGNGSSAAESSRDSSVYRRASFREWTGDSDPVAVRRGIVSKAVVGCQWKGTPSELPSDLDPKSRRRMMCTLDDPGFGARSAPAQGSTE
jgi:hypothetical protein